MHWLRPIFAAALFGLAAAATAQTFPERNRAAVVDAAGVIPDAAEAELNAEIVAWNRETGHQLVVATVPSLQGRTVADYANGLFRHWELGRAGENDGVILLLAPSEREVRIEVGYGLEGVLTDALTSVIIRDTVRPALRDNRIGDALADGAGQIMKAAAVQTAPLSPAKAVTPEADPPFPWGFFLFVAVMILGPIALFWRSRRKRRRAQPRSREERRHATVTRRGAPYVSPEAIAALNTRAPSSASYASSSAWSSGSDSYASSSSSWDSSSSSSSSSSDSGFDSGGGSSGGGGSDSSY